MVSFIQSSRDGVPLCRALTATYRVYGRLDWLGIAIRWPVSLYINMVATFRAWKIYLGESQLATSPIVWSKTAHDVPDDFLAATR
jgi:bacteriophage N4 adsorption protein B